VVQYKKEVPKSRDPKLSRKSDAKTKPVLQLIELECFGQFSGTHSNIDFLITSVSIHINFQENVIF
jgi:hypothetical protein